jgi:hypothetical protein
VKRGKVPSSPDATPPGRTSRKRSPAPKGQPTPPDPRDSRLWLVIEVAAFLQLTPRTVKALLKRGELRGHLIAGRWRVAWEDLARFIAEAPCEWSFTVNPGQAE